ncbi:MAG: ATP-dependent metallopeptidase FtsH/Yme1/Tma family protein, partial [Lysobacteraceae bacterium]
MNDLAKNLLLWVIVAVVLLAVFKSFSQEPTEATTEVAYSSFLDEMH